MSTQTIKLMITDQMASGILILLLTVSFAAGTAISSEHRFSDQYVMDVDEDAKKQLGDQVFNEIIAFFDSAEKAIETKDLPALMELYSDNYKDGEHDKQSAERIWKRIFSRFDGMATHHNMELVNVSAEKNMIILSCSGLLLGVPDPEQRAITVDNWTQQNHMLVKEGGLWKLIGSYGKDRKRLWFDKPMHPLF